LGMMSCTAAKMTIVMAIAGTMRAVRAPAVAPSAKAKAA
jgi:hypothetical protein